MWNTGESRYASSIVGKYILNNDGYRLCRAGGEVSMCLPQAVAVL